MDRYDEDVESGVGGWKRCDLAPEFRSSLGRVANEVDMAVCIGEVMFQARGGRNCNTWLSKGLS